MPHLRQTTKDELQNFQRVLKEREPAVQLACRALQDVIGIEPGTRMIGHLPVTLWKLPDPPKDTPNAILERSRRHVKSLIAWKQKHAAMTNQDTESPAEETDDSSEDSGGPEDLLWYPEQGGEMMEDANDIDMYDSIDETEDAENALFENVDFGDDPDSDDSGPKCEMPSEQAAVPQPTPSLKRKRHESPLLPPQRHTSAIKKPKIVIDLTDSPGKASDRPPLKLLPQPPTAEPYTNSSMKRNMASPPAQWRTPSRVSSKFRKAPVYWYSDLSMHVLRWLEQADTSSSQTNLTRFELRSNVYGEHRRDKDSHVIINAKDYSKVKITRISLPREAQSEADPTNLLNWLLIEVQYKNQAIPFLGYDSSDEEKKRSAKPPFLMNSVTPPYWLLAIPLNGITDSKTEHLQAQASPLRPQRRRQHQKSPVQQKGVRKTTLVLGMEGKVPLLHGMGVDKRFADEFFQACAKGKAAIVLRSHEAVPFDCSL